MILIVEVTKRKRKSLHHSLDDVDAGVVGFHRLADQWCRLANTMQDLVKVKQSSCPQPRKGRP